MERFLARDEEPVLSAGRAEETGADRQGRRAGEEAGSADERDEGPGRVEGRERGGDGGPRPGEGSGAAGCEAATKPRPIRFVSFPFYRGAKALTP